ncbi:hypothetical protein GWI33_019430 [Rhynchophorus ferrugineus]|uniref:Uncharacterized protein n=1 Tax=Rhynchophorus ferrugineus TaxID=354439 RepID=A0A834I5E9_RHYFE|nr:hypothetical protein GWI33_019430 [Rhynchophorus ferrugineus]
MYRLRDLLSESNQDDRMHEDMNSRRYKEPYKLLTIPSLCTADNLELNFQNFRFEIYYFRAGDRPGVGRPSLVEVPLDEEDAV